jgi:hypothetical protein
MISPHLRERLFFSLAGTTPLLIITNFAQLSVSKISLKSITLLILVPDGVRALVKKKVSC